MHSRINIKETAFAPGNLVFGGSMLDLKSFLDQGIRPAGTVGSRSLETPDNLCFALLSNKPLPSRYNDGFHYAPGGALGGYSVGIVVSGEALMAAYPEQVFAIGEYFWRRGYGDKRKAYNYDPSKQTVFDIPIRQPYGGLLFADEVRVYPKSVSEAAVKSDMWTGLIVDNYRLSYLPQLLKGAEIKHDMPVFSPRCALLARSLARQVASGR